MKKEDPVAQHHAISWWRGRPQLLLAVHTPCRVCGWLTMYSLTWLAASSRSGMGWGGVGWGRDIKITYSQIFEYSLGNMKEYSTHEKPIRFSLNNDNNQFVVVAESCYTMFVFNSSRVMSLWCHQSLKLCVHQPYHCLGCYFNPRIWFAGH